MVIRHRGNFTLPGEKRINIMWEKVKYDETSIKYELKLPASQRRMNQVFM
jgi:hypothetical protein